MPDTDQQVEVVQPTPSSPSTFSAEGSPGVHTATLMIQQAIDKGLPVETMERLLAMHKELKADAAKEAFDDAMAKLQGEMPVIQKTKSIKDKSGAERYKYAPIDAIITQTKEYIAKHGFSYAVTTEQSEVVGEVKAICTVKHRMGHAEHSTFRVPIDNGSFMSAPQKVAAALTFAKRYAFCNAFGIITGDEDNDATEDSPTTPPPRPPMAPVNAPQAPKPPQAGQNIKNPAEPASEAQLRAVATLRSKYGMPEEAFKAAYKITSLKQMTKGQASACIDGLKKRVDAGEQWRDPNLPIIQAEDENTFDDTGMDIPVGTPDPIMESMTAEIVPDGGKKPWEKGKWASKGSKAAENMASG